MRFDVKKYNQGSCYYSQMSHEALAFHDALERTICSKGRHIIWASPTKRQSVYPKVSINSTGEIQVQLVAKYKNEKAYVKLDDIQKSFEALVEFLSICCDHGYLMPEPPKEETT